MRRGLLQHTRLVSSAVVGIVLFLLLPWHWSMIVRILVSWNLSVLTFMVLIFVWMRRLTAKQICAQYIEEDESAGIILISMVFAAMLSLVAIVALLSTLKQVAGAERAAHVLLAAFTIADSWMLVPVMFTLHYADAFYSAPADGRPLVFPQTKMPVFWDFAYFSFTIAAACQTADVSTADSLIRRTVLVHTLISFLFNASILGFAINIMAGLFAGN